MTVCGIIAEYNPFHNGHLYHMEQSRQRSGADYLIVVLSGSFVQRGAPAFVDKYTRARMALEAGADLVIELPALFSCASAEDFAGAGVSLLDQLGVTDFLSFGAESQNPDFLAAAAQMLALEPPPFSEVLNRCLKEGMVFPKARATAMKSCHLPWNEQTEQELASPNNILALEYLKALYRRHSSIKPVIIPRTGSGYHSPDIREPFCSASAIRQFLTKKRPVESLSLPSAASPCASAAESFTLPAGNSGVMPAHAEKLLAESWQRACPVQPDDFSSMLSYQILADRSRGYTRYLDVSEELSRRIIRHAGEYRSFTRWTELLKTRQYTYTRAARSLCHILLQIPRETAQQCRCSGYTDYARVLGFRKSSAPLLSAIKANGAIPLLTRNADEKRLLTPRGKAVLKTEQFASALYDLAAQQKFPAAARTGAMRTTGIIVL